MVFGGNYFARGEFVLYINHSGKCVEINLNMKILYPLVPYPHTYIALYFSYAKVTCNTHKETRNCFHPSDARSLVSLTTTPLLSPFHWEERLLTPKLVIPVFGAVLCGSSVRRLPYFRS